MLKNKKILLAICGSISFYKSYEILSELKKLNADVRVALSDGVLNFTQIESFEALSGKKVLSSKSEDWANGVSHTEYSKVDLVLIAPATVNTINKLVAGVCDSVFMQTLIAANAPFIIAPAANDRMLDHFSTKNSLAILKENGTTIIDPVVKTLACGDVGKGALASVKNIVYAVIREFYKDKFYENRGVTVTGGSTTEKIDDVRAISNLSSGKMSKALADAFYFLGANVTFISSVEYEVPYKLTKFDSSFGLKSALFSQKFRRGDILVMNAAVSDFVPNKVKGKISKDHIKDVLTLNFRKNSDILSEFSNKDAIKIGFKLEVDSLEALDNAKDMLHKKDLDAVCLNILNGTVKFGSDTTKIEFITEKGVVSIDEDKKEVVAFEIANLIKKLRDE